MQKQFMHVFNRNQTFIKGNAANQAFRHRGFTGASFTGDQDIALGTHAQIEKILDSALIPELQKLMLKWFQAILNLLDFLKCSLFIQLIQRKIQHTGFTNGD